jgi:hypothetical protein
MRPVVLLGLAQESERRRAAGRPGAQIEGLRAGRRTRSGRACEFLEPRVRFVCGDLAIGVPVAATAAGWLVAGREPPAIARQAIE